MNIRLAALAALPLVVGVIGTADAAAPKKPKPVCNLLVDDKGDAGLGPVAAANAPGLDVVSADIATDGKKLTGVIRLAGPASAALDPTAPSGRTYHMEFFGQGGDNPVFLSLMIAPNATAAQFGHFDPATGINTGDGEATFKLVGNEIRMTTSLGNYGSYGKFKNGSKITGLSVTTGRMVGAYVQPGLYGYNSPTADTAEGGKVYVAGSPSCVKPGA
jgi:hypothetical protein